MIPVDVVRHAAWVALAVTSSACSLVGLNGLTGAPSETADAGSDRIEVEAQAEGMASDSPISDMAAPPGRDAIVESGSDAGADAGDGGSDAGILFVQGVGGHGAYPPTSNSVSIAFASSNQAGDLVVVSVGWGGGAVVSSVTDSAGNTYASAIGPTGSVFEEQLFYAKDVNGGGNRVNTVTVTMSATPPRFLECRAYEYAGLDRTAPLDRTSGQSGDGGCTSQSVMPGAGFVGRPVANGGAQLGEDRVLSGGSQTALETCDSTTLSSGSVATTASDDLLFGEGQFAPPASWVMQAVTFKSGQ